MKKRIISILLVMVLIFSVLAMTVSAAKMGDASEETSDGSGVTRTEEVVWYFRIYNGVKQMRLWSVTFNHWLTDWIDC